MDIDVFLSYNSKDETSAKLLYDILEKRGLNIWFAPRNISYGENYAAKIFEAIEKATIFTVLISNNSSKSFHVKNEIELAVRQIKRGILIMPVLLDQDNIDIEIQYYLSRQQWMDASTPPILKHFEDYAQHICCLLNKGQSPLSDRQGTNPEINIKASSSGDYQDFARKGNFQAAIEILENKIAQYGKPQRDVDSDYAMMCNVLGRYYERIGNYDKSITSFEQALHYAPDHALAGIQSNIATTYMAACKWNKAIDHYTEALVEQRIQFGHHNPDIYAARSNAYYKIGDLQNAQNDYLKALGLEKSN